MSKVTNTNQTSPIPQDAQPPSAGALPYLYSLFTGAIESPSSLAAEPEPQGDDGFPSIPKNHPFRKDASASFVAMQADFLISGTKWEGSSMQTQIKHLQKFLLLCKEHNLCSAETIQKLEHFFSTIIFTSTSRKSEETLAQEIAHAVYHLKPGESVPVEGFWKQKQPDGSFKAQNLMYTFAKTDKGLYDIHIYNAGEGINLFHDGLQIQEGMLKKNIFCPYVKFQDVDPAYLGFAEGIIDSGFFIKLLQLGSQALYGNTSPIKDLYASRQGFGALHGHLVTADENTPYMTEQRSGTDALSSIFAVLYPLFSSQEEYKMFKFWLKYSDLCCLFDKTLGQNDLEVQYLMQDVAKKLLRALVKRSACMTEDLRQVLQDRLLHIIHYLEKPEKKPSTSNVFPLQETSNNSSIDLHFQHTFDPSRSSSTSQSNLFFLQGPLSIQTLPSYLTKALQLKDPSTKAYAIEQAASFLFCLSKDDVEAISLSNADFLSLIRSTLQEYCKSCPEVYKETSQVARNTAWSLVVIARDITCRLAPRLKNYTIAHAPLRDDKGAELYIEYSTEESKKLEKILSSLQTSQGGNLGTIFDLSSYKSLTEKSPMPPEMGWLIQIAYPDRPDINFKDLLSLLVKEDQLLDSGEGKALIYMRDMVFWAYQFCPSTQLYNKSVTNSVSEDFYISKTTRISGDGHEEITYRITSSENFRLDSQDAWRHLWSVYYPHPSSTLAPENELLFSPSSFDCFGDITPASSGNAALRCSKLLHHVSQHFSWLKKPSNQKKFFDLLFHSLPDQNPAIWDALQNKEFTRQMQDFIQQGIRVFSIDWLTKKPSILPCLFFLRLQRRLQNIEPTLSWCDAKGQIDTWLERSDLSLEEQALLHLHRILHYTSYPKEYLESGDLIAIFSSWTFCKDYSYDKEGDGPYQKQEALRYILSLSPHVKALSSQNISSLVSAITKKDLQDLHLADTWTPSSHPGTYTNNDWSISLFDGSLFYKNTEFSVGSSKDIKSYFTYKMIFGEEMSPKITKEENTYVFEDMASGNTFRYARDRLQVLFRGVWYEYLSEPESTTLPSFFWGKQSNDYLCFVHGKDRLYLDRSSRKGIFATNTSKQLENLSTQGLVLQDLEESSLDLFEESQWRLQEIHKGRKSIQLPRYTSTQGEKLHFIENAAGELVLEGYPDYILIEPCQDILGPLKTMLCCKNVKTGEIKIFVPMRPTAEKGLAPATTLFLDTSDEKMTQLHSRTYLEYTYADQMLTCKDLEAKIFLSYLYQIQRQEAKALEILDSLGKDVPRSDKVTTILSWMTDFHGTPSALAVAMKAAVQLQIPKITESLLRQYQNTYNNIPSHLQLTQVELERLQISSQDIYSSAPTSPAWEESTSASRSYFYSIPDDFLQLYAQLSATSSAKERIRILATTSVKFEEFPGPLQSILAKAEHIEGPIPPFSVTAKSWSIHYHERCTEWGEATLKTLHSLCPSYYYKDCKSPLFPPKKKIKNRDISPHKYGALQSLPFAKYKAQIPSRVSITVSEKNSPLPWQGLEEIFARHCALRPSPSFTAPPPLATPGDLAPSHAAAIALGMEEVNSAMSKEARRRQGAVFATLQEGSTVQMVHELLSELTEQTKKQLEEEKNALLSVCKVLPPDPIQAEPALLLHKSDALAEVTWDDLVSSYLQGTYFHLNPHITEEDWEKIDAKMQNLLLQETYLQQIRRALLEKNPERLAHTLQERANYTPSASKEDRAFLVYEYRSGHRIRKEQIEAIRTLLSQNSLVLQMMMGGGKTTVLTSIMLELLPLGTIPMFIPLPAQFDTQIANLSQTQYKHYRKHIIALQTTRQELTAGKLQWILDKLKQSMQYKEPIVTTQSCLQCLQLEWIYLLDQPNLSSTDETRRKLLTDILIMIKQHGVAILDEVDQILDIFKEHNFPTGHKEKIEPPYIDCILQIFTLHLDPQILQKLELLEGSQGSFPRQQYIQEILPIIAEKFFTAFREKMGLQESQRKDCIRYILEGVESPSWRKKLEAMVHSKDAGSVASAQLIFLAKGLFSHLLPSVMEQEVNKHYGLLPVAMDRKIIPYEGVNSPSPTLFADPYRAACLHFLTALSSPITKDQLKQLASSKITSVMNLVRYSDISLQDTDEYKEFFHLTGSALDKVYLADPEELEKAYQHTLAHPEKRLLLEKNFIQKHVGIYTKFYSANPQSLVHLFHSVKGLTGTPQNFLDYAEKLRKNTHRSLDVEAKIRMTLLERSDTGESKVYFTQSNDVQKTLESALKDNPRKEHFRCLLDPVGLFKDFSNEHVAKEILSYFTEDPNVSYVLFFGKAEESMGIPSIPMLIKKPAEEGEDFFIETLEGTRRESLLAKGIDPAKMILFCDEKHCEATDVFLPPHTLGLVTGGIQLKDRDLLQTLLRLRDYLGSQDVDIILSEKERDNYPASPTCRDILVRAQTEELITVSNQAFSSLGQKIHSIFREKAISLLHRVPTHDMAKQLRSALVSRQSMDPYTIFGKPSITASPIDAFAMQWVAEREKHPPILREGRTRYDVQHLRDSMKDFLPKLPTSVSLFQGISNTEMELIAEQQMVTELHTELQLEYEYYRHQSYGWVKEEVDDPLIFTISNLLQNPSVRYRKPYHKLFTGAPLTVTENFAYTEGRLLPIFSAKQKFADQILVIEDDSGLHARLLSTREGEKYKKQIQEGAPNMWLYLPDGHMHIGTEASPSIQDMEKLQEILFFANLFDGNLSYLVSHKERLIAHIAKTPTLKQLYLDFLELKSYQHPHQKEALSSLVSALSCIKDPSALAKKPSTIEESSSLTLLQTLWKQILDLLERLLDYLSDLHSQASPYILPSWKKV